MVSLYVILIVNCLILAVKSDQVTLNEDQQRGIQEKLDTLQLIEDFMRMITKPDAQTEAREEKCLPLGSECSLLSGPKCCTIRARCFVFDTYVKGGYVSHCKEYNGGVWLDNAGSFFRKLGRRIKYRLTQE